MARNTGPVWRISRRLNFSILETGEELTKRPYIPGQHGSPTKKVKQSNYGLQKAEKQKTGYHRIIPAKGYSVCEVRLWEIML